MAVEIELDIKELLKKVGVDLDSLAEAIKQGKITARVEVKGKKVVVKLKRE